MTQILRIPPHKHRHLCSCKLQQKQKIILSTHSKFSKFRDLFKNLALYDRYAEKIRIPSTNLNPSIKGMYICGSNLTIFVSMSATHLYHEISVLYREVSFSCSESAVFCPQWFVEATSAITRASWPPLTALANNQPLLQVVYALSGSCAPILDLFGHHSGQNTESDLLSGGSRSKCMQCFPQKGGRGCSTPLLFWNTPSFQVYTSKDSIPSMKFIMHRPIA